MQHLQDLNNNNIGGTLLTGGLLLACGFAASRFRVAGANQTLIRYGLGYGNKIKPSRSGFVWPGQRHRFISMEPTQTRMVVSCNSRELIPFNLPIVISTRPVDWQDDLEGFINYCKTYADSNPEQMRAHMEDLLAGDIRTSASELEVSDMIAKKQSIYTKLEDPVHKILRSVGIHTQKCNIEEVLDILKNGGYIDELRKKAIASAQNTAETDVKKSETDKRIAVAELERTALLEENKNKQQEAKSRAELAEASADELKRTKIADVEAKVAAQLKEVELQRKMYEEKQKTETERLRSETLSKAAVDAEARVREALGWGDSERAKSQGDADAIRTRADADCYSQQQQALGIFAKYKAKADGIREVNAAASENPELAQFQMALEAGLPQSLAQSSADALQNLKPTIWYTGGNSGDDPVAKIMDGLMSAAPFLKTMSEQSGLDVSRIFPKPDVKN